MILFRELTLAIYTYSHLEYTQLPHFIDVLSANISFYLKITSLTTPSFNRHLLSAPSSPDTMWLGFFCPGRGPGCAGGWSQWGPGRGARAPSHPSFARMLGSHSSAITYVNSVTSSQAFYTFICIKHCFFKKKNNKTGLQRSPEKFSRPSHMCPAIVAQKVNPDSATDRSHLCISQQIWITWK